MNGIATSESASQSSSQGAFAKQNNSREYLTFFLGSQEYGLDILRVQEIRQWSPVTIIPNTPDHVRGVINIRGEIVPIIDPRVRFGMEVVEKKMTTVIIIVKTNAGAKTRLVGIVVDAVSDVLNIGQDDTSGAEDPMVKYGSEFSSSILTSGESVIVVLNIDALIGEDTQ
ncbi:MAG: chemotaxis protein CheW [Myxococcota bacterium]